jgi:hypothetical protein
MESDLIRMAELKAFRLKGWWKAGVADDAADVDEKPELKGISAGLTITPSAKGFPVIKATTADPPVVITMCPIEGFIVGGRIAVRKTQFDVLLWAKCSALNIGDTPLIYTLRPHDATFNGQKQSGLPSISFVAPTISDDHDDEVDGEVVVDLGVVEWIETAAAVGGGFTIRQVPDGVRREGNELVFSAQGSDLDGALDISDVLFTGLSIDGTPISGYDFDPRPPTAADLGAMTAAQVGQAILEALINATLTTPHIDFIKDLLGGTALGISGVTSSVNFLTLFNAIAGGTPGFSMSGADANIGFGLVMKGLGAFNVYVRQGVFEAHFKAIGYEDNVDWVADPKGTGIARVGANQIGTRSISVVSVSGTLGAVPGHHYVTLLAAGGVTSLPTAIGNKSVYTWANTTNATIILPTTAGQTVDGATTFPVRANERVTVVSDGANWVRLEYSRTATDSLTTGEANMPRDRITGTGITMNANGSARMKFFQAEKTEVITQVKSYCGGQAMVGATLAKMGVFELNPSTGDVALLASTANDTSLWAAPNTAYVRPFVASFTKKRGSWYGAAPLHVGATQLPTFAGQNTSIAAEAGQAPRIGAVIAAPADFPSNVLAASVNDNSQWPYMVLLP